MTGPGGFDRRGDDEVVARLSVDLPPEAATNLQQLARQAQDLRTTMEAIAKAQGDYNQYVRSLPELLRRAEDAQQRYTAQAKATADAHTSGSAPDASSAAPSANTFVNQMLQQPEFRQMMSTVAAAAVGVSGALAPTVNPATGGAAGAPRPEQVRDVAAAMDQLRQRDPRQFANLMAQNGAGVPQLGPEPPPSAPRPIDERIAQRGEPEAPVATPEWFTRGRQVEQSVAGVLSKIMSQTSAGGGVGAIGMGAAAAQGSIGLGMNIERTIQRRIEQAAAEAVRLDEARAEAFRNGAPEDEISGLETSAAMQARRALRLNQVAGLGRGLVRVGGAVGLAAGAAAAVQEGGEWVQRHRNVGMVRGGGFQEGMQFEMGVRTMALNPFISLEQSRRIMQSALSEGYTGKEFETVTDFMAENLRRMNLDTAQSLRMISNQVNIGGQSMLGAQMDALAMQRFVQMNPESRLTAPAMLENFQKGIETGVQAGFTGETSARLSGATNVIWADTGIMRNEGPNIADALTNNLAAQNLVAGLHPDMQGTPFDVVSDIVGKPGGEDTLALDYAKILENQVRAMAPKLNSEDAGIHRSAVQSFVAWYNSIFNANINERQASTIIDKALSDQGLQGMAREQLGEMHEARTGGPGAGASVNARLFNLADASVGAVRSALGGLAQIVPNAPWNDEVKNWGNQGQEHWEENRAMMMSPWMNPALESLIASNEVNAGEVMLKGADGQEISLLDAMSSRKEDLLKGLPGGQTLMKLPGSEEFTTFEQASAQLDATNADTGADKGATMIDLTERAAEYLRKVVPEDGRNATQNQADRQVGGATRQDWLPGLEQPGG